MISEYITCGGAPWEEDREGMLPTFDVWGTVLPPADRTEKGSVRVKVKTMKDNMDTFDNVPVLTGYGGGDHGAFFLPEEGDTVRLTFLGGDFRHPVVTGCRFPKSSAFVEEASQKENLKKVWKGKNGSEILMSGEKGKDKIQVSGSEKMLWELDEEKQQTALGDRDKKNRVLLDKKNGTANILSENSIHLECGKSSLELKKDGTVLLQCEQLTLEAKTVQIKAKTKVQVKGQEITADGATGISISAKGQVKVESKGPLKLSGAMIHLN